MSQAEGAVELEPELTGKATPKLSRLWIPVLAALVVMAVVLCVVVAISQSAWVLLGVGRGLIEPEYYPISGVVAVLATMLGQALGWVGGSALVYYILTLMNFSATWNTGRIAMSLVYVGLAGVPLLAYHFLLGQPLSGTPNVGLEAWVARHYPDAAWLLFTAHPVIDLSLIPLGLIFLGVLWKTGEQPLRNLGVQLVLALALLGTSLTVALSLAIHSTLVHIRIIP